MILKITSGCQCNFTFHKAWYAWRVVINCNVFTLVHPNCCGTGIAERFEHWPPASAVKSILITEAPDFHAAVVSRGEVIYQYSSHSICWVLRQQGCRLCGLYIFGSHRNLKNSTENYYEEELSTFFSNVYCRLVKNNYDNNSLRNS